MNGRDKGQGKREWARHARRDGGFTVIELSIVLVIIAVVTSLAFVTFSRAIRTGRDAGERMFMISLKTAVEQFKADNGFLPPLLDDRIAMQGGVGELPAGIPIDRVTRQPIPRSAAFLRGEIEVGVQRFSIYSLPFYLAGTLGAAEDGIDGPGYTKVLEDGTFSRKGRKIEPLFDFGRDPARIRRRVNDPNVQATIVDRWGKVSSSTTWLPMNTIRYYRWEPAFYPAGHQRAGQVQRHNVPKILIETDNAPLTEEMRYAGFAILSKGPDGAANERPLPGGDPRNLDNLVEVGK